MTYVNRWGVLKEYTYNSIDGPHPPLTVKDGFLAGHKYYFILEKNNESSEFEFIPVIAEVDNEEQTEGNWNSSDDVHNTFN